MSVVLFLLVVVVMPAVTTVVAVDRFPSLSTLDEYAHIDYLRRIEDGEVPRIGDKVLPETARDVACRTIEGRRVSDCTLPEIPIEAIDAGGYSYEAQQPPLYYAITAVLRQPISLVVNGFVNSARLTGMIWLSAGLGLLWWVLRRRMGTSAMATAVVCGVVGLAPTVMSQAAVVNNDAPAVLTGTLLLLGYDQLRTDDRPRTALLAALVAVVLVLVKPLAILGVGAVTLALLLGSWDRRDSLRRAAWLVTPAVASVVAYQGWQAVRDARSTVPYAEVMDVLLGAKVTLTEFPFDSLGSHAPRFLLAYWSADASMFAPVYVTGVAACVGMIFVVTPSVMAAMGEGRARHMQHLQLGVLAVMLVAPLLLITQSYFVVHKGGGANARYALTLLPLTITGLVPLLERTVLRWAAAASVGILFTVTMIGIATYRILPAVGG